MASNLVPLSLLREGDNCVIRELVSGDLSLKLMELGFLPGEIVVVDKIAPLGDPISVKIGTYLLSLRKEEADVIMVQRQTNESV